jgi:hypothetical protein
MIQIAENFASLEREMAQRRGDFVLFALFLREDVPDRWDLVVAAPWIGEHKDDAVAYIVQEIQSRLSPQDLVQLSRIVVVDPSDPAVDALVRSIRVEHGRVEVRDSVFFGVPVKHALIVTAQPRRAAA